jgi:hypothetical protein
MGKGKAASSVAGAFQTAAGSFGLELRVVELHLPGSRDLYEADLALIRPDQIVAWRGSGEDLDVNALFRVVTGHETGAAQQTGGLALTFR